MKGIRTCLLTAVALLLAAPAWSFSFFGLFGSGDDDLEALLEGVPADTAWVTLGQLTTDGSELLDGWQMDALMADTAELSEVMPDTAGLEVLAWLWEDYLNIALSTGYQGEVGYQALMSRYGFAEEGAYAFYLDGAVPVLRYSLEDPEALRQVLQEASGATARPVATRTVNGLEVQHWQLTSASAKRRFDLAVAIDDRFATFSLLSEIDDDQRLAQRFGSLEQDDSLADSEAWQSLVDNYDFDDFMRGYLDLAGLAEAFLQPQNNRMGRDLQRLAPGPMADINANLAPACSEEWVDLARRMPRLAYGSQDYQANAERIYQQGKAVLEINNSAVTDELSKLSGFIPAYSRDASDKLFALALGLDVDALAPVASALWSQLGDANFDCPQLVQLQQQATQWNPAMLGMVSGMAQGLKGAGLAVYDLQADSSNPLGISGSVLLSVSADDPRLLANSLTASVPPLAGLRIPADGTPVTLPLPQAPQPVQVAIKGKHLVAYTGEAAQAAANAMADESLNRDGNWAFAVDYQKTGKSLISVLDSPGGSFMQDANSAGNCTDLYVSWLQLGRMPMQISYADNYSERGWEAEFDAVLSQPEAPLQIEPGRYRTETLEDDCSWYGGSFETLNSDGSGQYSEPASNGQCDLYRIDYRWRQEGGKLIQESTGEQSRNSCQEDWQDVAASDYECTLMGAAKNGFYCLYYFDGEATLMRYRR